MPRQRKASKYDADGLHYTGEGSSDISDFGIESVFPTVMANVMPAEVPAADFEVGLGLWASDSPDDTVVHVSVSLKAVLQRDLELMDPKNHPQELPGIRRMAKRLRDLAAMLDKACEEAGRKRKAA